MNSFHFSDFVDILVDSFKDSFKVFAFAFILFVIFSIVIDDVALFLQKKKKQAPLIGSLAGVIPECGIPVVAAFLYKHRKISLGTIVAIFLACSDEAIPILLSSSKWQMGLLLILIKVIYGFLVGLLIDFLYKSKVDEGILDVELYCGCDAHRYFLHPLADAFKIFCYAFIINILFGTLVFVIGEANILNFLQNNRLLTVFTSVLVGLIPNCSSSILLSTLYINNGLAFGALLAGLSVNAGLGLLYLVKSKDMWMKTLLIVSILIFSSLLLGFIFIFV